MATRSRFDGSCRSNIDIIRLVTVSGASAKSAATTSGRSAVRRKSLQAEQQRHRRAGADPGAAAERQRQRDDQRRHHQRRPRPLARAEHHARQRRAHHQHQHAGVGHVVGERALRPLAQVVVVQHRVLDDAVGGAGGADGDHHVHTVVGAARRGPACRRPAPARTAPAACCRRCWPPGRARRPPTPASRRRRPPAAQNAGGADGSARSRTSTATQHRNVSVSRMPAAAIESCSRGHERQQRECASRSSAEAGGRPARRERSCWRVVIAIVRR